MRVTLSRRLARLAVHDGRAAACPHASARIAWWLYRVAARATPSPTTSSTRRRRRRGARRGGPRRRAVAAGPGARPAAPAGARSAGLALPVAGDPLGLGGPRDFNAEALEAGEAVVVEGAGLGLVPHRAGAGVVWVASPRTARASCPTSARPTGRCAPALLESATALADLDVARWRPEVADELMDLRHRTGVRRPGRYAAACGRPGRPGLQALGIVELALEDDGGAVSALRGRCAARTPCGRSDAPPGGRWWPPARPRCGRPPDPHASSLRQGWQTPSSLPAGSAKWKRRPPGKASTVGSTRRARRPPRPPATEASRSSDDDQQPAPRRGPGVPLRVEPADLAVAVRGADAGVGRAVVVELPAEGRRP